jgi:hypothetical protein
MIKQISQVNSMPRHFSTVAARAANALTLQPAHVLTCNVQQNQAIRACGNSGLMG